MQRDAISRRRALGLLSGALACPAAARSSVAPDPAGAAFGTQWRVAGPPGAAAAADLGPALVALFAGIDAELSPYRPDSALSRFNASPAGGQAGAELLRVARAALRIARLSGGAFDPTVGPLVARWGFGPISGRASAGGPSPAEGWRGLGINAGRLSKTHPDLTFDPCGIAKGRALDRATALAAGLGLDRLLIDLGGELSALGRHPSGRDWRVAVEHPLPGSPAAAVLHLPAGMAVATSGLGVQSYTLGGRVWSHVMDPAAAAPVQGRLRAVTVLAADAMTADGWATALLAAGDDAGPELARARDIAALFLYDDGARMQRVETGGIGAVLT
ncbi:FAD:protein FMN transferase [Meridianimarinicoccus roseus]|uniref:FAD:protein FMN transferase n=1 Tax=Meridianimarinicoccus roseus TaxID=2072018 RepID=A0A2V2LQS9_9RHOB|nr:FAD:protein FMN transferase [Meridianimarinicoccus roseus]PWR04569.1 FAD:protein FMN transferase [Meridianimarinicoccus roseus]